MKRIALIDVLTYRYIRTEERGWVQVGQEKGCGFNSSVNWE